MSGRAGYPELQFLCPLDLESVALAVSIATLHSAQLAKFWGEDLQRGWKVTRLLGESFSRNRVAY